MPAVVAFPKKIVSYSVLAHPDVETLPDIEGLISRVAKQSGLVVAIKASERNPSHRQIRFYPEGHAPKAGKSGTLSRDQMVRLRAAVIEKVKSSGSSVDEVIKGLSLEGF